MSDLDKESWLERDCVGDPSQQHCSRTESEAGATLSRYPNDCG